MNERSHLRAEGAMVSSVTPYTPVRSGILQRKCACGGVSGHYGDCEPCRDTRLARRGATPGRTERGVSSAVNEVLRSPGQPLDHAARTALEPRFGHDFGAVRVHSDAQAADTAASMGAVAYTVGRDVVFATDRYEPGTSTGQALIAHELTHVVQQRSRQREVTGVLETTSPTDAVEREADAAEHAVSRGRSFAPALRANAQLARQVTAPVCAHPGDIRSVDLQPVFFRSSAVDTSPTGTSWARRLGSSNTIWGKLGVTFAVLSPVTIEDATHKTAGTSTTEYHAIRATRAAAGLEVFMVDNAMASFGGGGTVLGGTANAQIVLSDRGTSDTLLAHELGHALGLDHPPGGSDANTIMTPFGSNSSANPTRNTMGNYGRITWPSGSGSTCLHPDP